MLDTILVGGIIVAAAYFIGRRFYKQFSAKGSACGCSGCGQSNSCGSIQSRPDSTDCNQRN